jgi:hypothetical protein
MRDERKKGLGDKTKLPTGYNDADIEIEDSVNQVEKESFYHQMIGGVVEGYDPKQESSSWMKRCVASVGKKPGVDTSGAFAICTSQGQKAGLLKKGTSKPTKKGASRAKSLGQQPEHGKKLADYEKMLKRSTEDSELSEKVLVIGPKNDVGNTIMDQLGGYGPLVAMLGIKQLKYLPKGLAFLWPARQRSRGNYVEITLRGDDTYDMEFFNVSKSGKKSVKKFSGVYNDQLVPIFEKHTGWRLRLSSRSLKVGEYGLNEDPIGMTAVWSEGEDVLVGEVVDSFVHPRLGMTSVTNTHITLPTRSRG